jgi:hypothetical protein
MSTIAIGRILLKVSGDCCGIVYTVSTDDRIRQRVDSPLINRTFS